jgi:hypothetical protein
MHWNTHGDPITHTAARDTHGPTRRDNDELADHTPAGAVPVTGPAWIAGTAWHPSRSAPAPNR